MLQELVPSHFHKAAISPLAPTDDDDDELLTAKGDRESEAGDESEGVLGVKDDDYVPPGPRAIAVKQVPSPSGDEVDELESDNPAPPPPLPRRSTRRATRPPGKFFYFFALASVDTDGLLLS